MKTENISIKKVKVTSKTPLISSSPLTFTNFTEQETTDEVEDIIERDKLAEYGNFYDGYESDDSLPISTILVPKSPSYNFDMAKRITASTIVATGTAIAMMPIFNFLVRHSEELGINVHDDHALYSVSTANTFIVSFATSFSSVYHVIKKHQLSDGYQPENCIFIIGKTLASFSMAMPICLLWGIELHNQSVSESSGFDEFLAWATFSTVPLMITHAVEAVKTVNHLYQDKDKDIILNSIGSKIALYGLTTLSIVGRGIAYTAAVKNLASAIGLDETTSLGIGIAAGGVIGASSVGIFEHYAVKRLFAEQTEDITPANTVAGIASAIEGAWFSLPTLSLGLQATEDWNPLLRGVLFTPVLLSSTIYGSTKLYDNLHNAYDTIADGMSQIMGYCNDTYEDTGG